MRILGKAAAMAQADAARQIEMAQTPEEREAAEQAAASLEESQNTPVAPSPEDADAGTGGEAAQGSFPCPQCDYVAPDQEALEKHVAKHNK
jgi:hypothetical protein